MRHALLTLVASFASCVAMIVYFSARDGVRLDRAKIHRQECKILRVDFAVGGFMTQKGLKSTAKKRTQEDRGALSKEEGNEGSKR